jgi:hypothetical protein
MMKKLILTDCDGVLLNWEYAFNCWMEERGFDPVRADVYDMAVRYGKTKAEMKGLIKIFNECAAIGFLPPQRDAMHYVKKLHEEHGFVFRVITSLSLNPYAKKLRIRNLEKLFGTAIDDVVCLDTGADKDEALEPYRDSGLIWIEDKVENARVGNDMGLNSILVEHEHNMNEKDFPLAKNWKEIYDMVTGEC